MTTANNKTLTDGRVLTLWVLAVFGLFALAYGLGGGYAAIGTLGGAVAVLGPGFIVLTSLRSKVREVVRGSAYVTSVSPEEAPDGAVGRCELHLRVEAYGVHGATARVRDRAVPVTRWPYAGQTLPVLVANRKARRAQVLWDQVPVRDDLDSYPDPEYADAEFTGTEFSESEFTGSDFAGSDFDDADFTLLDLDDPEAGISTDPEAAAESAATSGYEIPGYPAEASDDPGASAGPPGSGASAEPEGPRSRPSPRPRRPAPEESSAETVVVAHAAVPPTAGAPTGAAAHRTPRIVELKFAPVVPPPRQAEPAEPAQSSDPAPPAEVAEPSDPEPGQPGQPG